MTFPEVVTFWISQATRFVSPQMTAVEWFLAGVIGACLIIAPKRPWRWLASAQAGFTRFADNRRLAVIACGVVPVILRLAMLGIYPVPEPSIHDEFSHLLLADTLAHGRFSNPVHPEWQHFESIHIIQQPTYSSMYPPANGMFLAAGELVTHEPWAGVLLSAGLMFAALCWMMQQWLPASWALYGTVIAICRIGVFGPWLNSYLGGPVSALGGALLIGAVPGLRKSHPSLVHSFVFGIGLVILMNSRPFEGAILATAAFLYLLPGLTRTVRTAGLWASRSIWAPAAILLILGFVFTGYYNARVTGHATKLPYEVNRDTYGWPENLAFLPAKAISFRHQTLKDMYQVEIDRRAIFKKWNTFTDSILTRLFENWMFYLGPLLTLPFLASLGISRRLGILPLLVFIALIACVNLFQLVLYPYHLGPVVAITYTLVAAGLFRIFTTFAGWRPIGARIALGVLPFCLLGTALAKQNSDTLGLPITYWERSAEVHRDSRASIQHWLSTRPGKQLVIVRYGKKHSPNQEWVYNGADIDGSPVVWAREMDPASDRSLLSYFHDRKAWLLEADLKPPRVVPYFGSKAVDAPDDFFDSCSCADKTEAQPGP